MKINKLIFLFILLLSLEQKIFAEQQQPIQISEIFLKRKSGKDYDPARKVSKDQLVACAKAAQWSPSSYNNQPWHFIICDRDENPEAYQNALNSLIGSNPTWAQNAPVLIIISTSFQPDQKSGHSWALYDVGAAALAWSLQATELGLMAHQIGGFDQEMIRNDFQIPGDYQPTVIMTLGYEAQNPRQRNRVRKPISENFNLGTWGLGLEAE